MKIFALYSLLTYAAIASAAAAAAAVPRFRRDVAEPESAFLPPAAVDGPPAVYLPPPQDVELEASTTELPSEAEVVDASDASAVLGAQGYEYRSVRRLKLRQRRDVSHIAQHYLPPHNEYLPPTADEAVPVEQENNDTVEVVSAAVKLANEYLPPTAELYEATVASTETAETTATPATEAAPTVEEQEQLRIVDVPKNSAILRADGYHYKQPVPDAPHALREAATEYFPPLNAQVVVEGPEESAVLAKDGYHYRAVKRFRF